MILRYAYAVSLMLTKFEMFRIQWFYSKQLHVKSILSEKKLLYSILFGLKYAERLIFTLPQWSIHSISCFTKYPKLVVCFNPFSFST